ncbi:DUF2269 family protein [Aquibium sp. A9E412]|uniref:DUF2269 family protein n=1 Tax=Aquibium sp. A9E412 TaxID=2976767 RepID=UPI0025B1BD17|nr:DUF2269 family protein [Aquibium sp. A9E412]MDN2565962.1 DUF2269 family protein [Aquibium sp. A9E412]
MRKLLKCLHTLAACGLIGGLAVYMLLLALAPQETPAAYAQLRQAIAAVSNYLLMPSLAVALVSGLLSMAVHTPFLDKRWVWLKAAMGILMFKGVLTIVGAKADYAAALSRRIAEGTAAPDALAAALAHEWATLWVVMALSVANVVLGVWRPGLARRQGGRSAAARPAA